MSIKGVARMGSESVWALKVITELCEVKGSWDCSQIRLAVRVGKKSKMTERQKNQNVNS